MQLDFVDHGTIGIQYAINATTDRICAGIVEWETVRNLLLWKKFRTETKCREVVVGIVLLKRGGKE